MVTGRISLRSPEYSPISSSVSEVRAMGARSPGPPETRARARGLADLRLGQRGAGDELALPLPPRDGVGHQDERGRPGLRHGRGADQRLARTARQDDDARPAGPEALDGLLLVVAQVPAVLRQLDGVRLTVDVAGAVLRRPADPGPTLPQPGAA